MKSIIPHILVPLFLSRSALGAAIVPATDIQATSNSSSLFAQDITPHCSRDYASYGPAFPGNVACILAIYDLMQSPRISTLPNMYPMDFVSSTAPLPAEGNGFRTPWRTSYGGDQHGCTVAIALLSEVPERYTPEVAPTPSGQHATAFKGSLQQAGDALLKCFHPTDGTGRGWVEVPSFSMLSDDKVGIFAFKPGSPIDEALPKGLSFQGVLSSNLTAAAATE